MAEYIEREALLKEIGRRKSIARTSFPKQNFCVNDVLHCVYDAPAADVVEARHGEWEVRGQDVCCSVCGGESAYNPFGASKFSIYCPNCGAKMDGKGEGEC